MTRFIIPFLLLLLFAGACSQPIPNDIDLVIDGATIVDVDRGELRPDRSIFVTDGMIVDIRPSGSFDFPPGARVVRASGQYVMPGLTDMHVHLLYPAPLERYGAMLVANGVTTVRDMNTPISVAQIDSIRQRIRSGRLVAPRFTTPIRLVDGPARSQDARGPEVIVVTTPDEAREAVRSLGRKGADFIKVYNSLAPDLLDAVIDEAHVLGMKASGHIPHPVPAGDASTMGLDSAEHLNNVLEACSAAGSELTAETAEVMRILARPGNTMRDIPQDQIQRVLALRKDVIHSFDVSTCGQLIDTFIQNGTWQTPTLVSNRAVDLAALDSSFDADARMRYVPESIQASWAASAQRHPSRASPEERRIRFDLLKRIVGMMREKDLPLLAGTDLGAPYVYAGSSLHDELELLVESGLSPAEALRTATVNPAQFTGQQDSVGTVDSGKRADLVLLNGNPLESISNTRTIQTVIFRGQVLDRTRLDTLLERAASLSQES